VRHATTGDSLYYMVTREKQSLKNLKVFGCRAYVLILLIPSKFERRAEPGVILGCISYGVYKVLVSSKGGRDSKIFISRHVTFDKEGLPGLKDMEDIMDGDRASDSSYVCKSARFDSDYSESESEYFDPSSEEHSSDSDYSSDGGPAKLVKIEMARRLTQMPKRVLP
jgi:hypothetical protein